MADALEELYNDGVKAKMKDFIIISCHQDYSQSQLSPDRRLDP